MKWEGPASVSDFTPGRQGSRRALAETRVSRTSGAFVGVRELSLSLSLFFFGGPELSSIVPRAQGSESTAVLICSILSKLGLNDRIGSSGYS